MSCRSAHFTTDRGSGPRGTPFSVHSGSEDSEFVLPFCPCCNLDWSVSNPDELKGHEGHQVTVSANVYADKNEINVVSVEMGKKDSMK